MRFAAAVVAAAVVLAVVVAAAGLWFANDAPQHAFAAFVHNHYGAAEYGYDKFLALNDPPSTRMYFEIFRVLESAFGWRAAYSVAVVVVAELWALSFLALVAALEPKRKWLALVGFAFALQLPLYHGIFPYCIATACGFFAIAAWLRPHPARYVVVAVALYVSARAQLPATMFSGIVLGIITLVRATTWRERARELALLALASAPSLWVMASTAASVKDVADNGASDVVPVWESALGRTLLIERMFQPGPAWRAVAALALVVVGWVAGARRGTRIEKAFAATSLVLVLASMALPHRLAGWDLAGERLMPFGTMLAVALVDVERLVGNAKRAAAALAACYAVAVMAWSAWLHVQQRAQFAPIVDALDQKPALGVNFLPIVTTPFLDDRFPDYLPLFHVGQLFAISYGGLAEYGQDVLPLLHPVLRKPDPDRVLPPPMELVLVGPKQEIRRSLAYASAFGGALVVGTKDDVAAAKDAGFVPYVENERVFFGAFRGCTGRVRVVGAAVDVGVSVGWWPMKQAAAHLRVPSSSPSDEIVLGCGDVWVHVDGPSSSQCREGTPARATWRDGAANELVCTLE